MLRVFKVFFKVDSKLTHSCVFVALRNIILVLLAVFDLKVSFFLNVESSFHVFVNDEHVITGVNFVQQ
jgi:hypothetical protein